jgi:thiol:disulfide interchange protein
MMMLKAAAVSLAAAVLAVGGSTSHAAAAGNSAHQSPWFAQFGGGGTLQILPCLQLPVIPIIILSRYEQHSDCSFKLLNFKSEDSVRNEQFGRR